MHYRTGSRGPGGSGGATRGGAGAGVARRRIHRDRGGSVTSGFQGTSGADTRTSVAPPFKNRAQQDPAFVRDRRRSVTDVATDVRRGTLPAMWLLAACARTHPFDLEVALVEDATAPAEPVDPFTWDVSMYDERSSAYLPAFLDVEDYGAVLLADALLRPDEGFLAVTVADLATDVEAPLALVFTISSVDGRRFVAAAAADVVAPAACTLAVDATTTSEAHAADLLACLRAWADANGGPNELYVEVVATTADDDWSFAASYTFGADRPVVAACSGPQVVDDEIREEADGVEFEELGLAGYAASEDERLVAVAFANTYPASDAFAGAGGHGATTVAAGEGAFVGAVVEVASDVPATITFRDRVDPASAFPADWADAAYADLTAPDGFVDACVVQVPDAVPNDSWTYTALVGSGTVER